MKIVGIREREKCKQMILNFIKDNEIIEFEREVKPPEDPFDTRIKFKCAILKIKIDESGKNPSELEGGDER